MTIKRNSSILEAKIVQGGRVTQRYFGPKDKLTIGRSPDNDIIVYDDAYPKKHVLIECKKNTCSMKISPAMTGEIEFKGSKVTFNDLFVHNLLPQKGNFYNLEFTHGRSGSLRISDTDIFFNYNGHQPETLKGLPLYTWNKAIGKTFTKDLLYKSLFLILFSIEIIIGFSLKGYELPPEEPPDVTTVPERFARFMIKKPTQPPETEMVATTSSGEGEAEEETTQEQESQQEQPKPGGSGGSDKPAPKPVNAQGLLGLIGGTGSSGSSSSAADFLIEQGFVQELDQLIGSKPLTKSNKIGKGNGTGDGGGTGDGDGIDELMAFGLSGGVDDLLSEVEGVETVDLKKQGKVNIQQPQRMRGSQEARAQRTSESVMSIINSQQGRVMYTYNKYLRTNPDLRGKVSFDVTIEANGSVSNIQILESSIDNQDFVRELMNIVRRLKFPPIREGSITVNLPFVFNRVN